MKITVVTGKPNACIFYNLFRYFVIATKYLVIFLALKVCERITHVIHEIRGGG